MPEEALINAWFAAAKSGDCSAAEVLLRRGVAVDATDEFGTTALSMAVRYDRHEMLRLLLSRGANPNAPGFRGCTPTTKAVEHTNPKLSGLPDRTALDLLVAAGGRLGLREAVLLGDVDLARRLCDADPDLDISGNADWSWNDTYLMVAVRYGTPEVVRFLLDRGADIEETDDLGATALMRAAGAGDRTQVTLLLDRGADVNNGDWAGGTPLSEAAQGGHREVFDLLLARGARRTVLDAATWGESAVVGSILDAGSDQRFATTSGYTRLVLRAAVRSGDAATVRLVLGRTTALADIERSKDLSPLIAAAEAGNAEIAQILRDWTAFCEEGSDLGPAPLLIDAAQRGHLEVVRALLDHYLDPSQRDHRGRTARDWAVQNGHEAVAALLDDRSAR